MPHRISEIKRQSEMEILCKIEICWAVEHPVLPFKDVRKAYVFDAC